MAGKSIGESYNRAMAIDPGEILRQALSLPPEARAALADSLLDSIDSERDEQVEEKWREEIKGRIVELESGAVQTTRWPEVRARLIDRSKG